MNITIEQDTPEPIKMQKRYATYGDTASHNSEEVMPTKVLGKQN